MSMNLTTARAAYIKAKTSEYGALRKYAEALTEQFGEGWWNMLARLLTLTAVGAGTMFLAAWRLRMPEWKWAIGIAEADTRPDVDTP